MRSIKRKSLAVGITASLALGTMLPGATQASFNEPWSEFNKKLEEKNTYGMKAKLAESKFSTNQLIVKYSSPLSSSEHRKAGGTLEKRISSLGYDIIRIPAGENLEDVAKKYAGLSNVISVSKSAYAKQLASGDIKEASMYHIKNLNLAKAQTMAGKNKVRVAVVDSGVDSKHPELKNKIVVNKNAMNPLKKGLPDEHGTHVAGIISAEKGNGIGGYGIAPNAEIVSIDVFNRSMFVTDYTIAEGVLEAIRQKVDVINMSLGMYHPSPILKDAIQKALEAGIVVVAAAGNDGAAIANYPASFDGVISVGALDQDNQLAVFSTYGPSVDVVAPGQDVYSTVYDFDKGSSFVNMSGTSMSSPVVAGAVALLLSKHPNLTPYQVNYVLNKTAKDLGEKGYDQKYGFGMIDLEKLLSFDPKKIPADPTVSKEEAIAKAKDLGEFENVSKEGKLLALNQVDLYKTKLEKDESLQVILEGTNHFDLKYELLFYKEGEKKPSYQVEVNDRKEGNLEGGLFKAPENGTIVISIKDSFGKYSEAGASSYQLTLQKSVELVDEGNTEETPEMISSLPYQSQKDNYYIDEWSPSEEDGDNPEVHGDSDYYHFKVPGSEADGMQTVKIDLSGVPGINPSLKLHLVEVFEGESYVEELEVADTYGFGKGEELTFNAVPGQEYKVEVTNKPLIDPIMAKLFGDFEIDNNRSYSSFSPYELEIRSTEHPSDEDGLPLNMEGEMEDMIEGDVEEYVAKKEELEEEAFSSVDSQLDEMTTKIKEAAIPFKENDSNKGYIQFMDDEDWYAFTPEEDAIFEVAFSTSKGYKTPGVDILKYDKELKDFMGVFSNVDFSFEDFTPKMKNQFYVGLQKGETYYFRLSDPMYRPSFEPYQFKVKAKLKQTADVLEMNNDFENAVSISTRSVTGNYAIAGDIDMYYFKPNKDSVFGLTIKPQSLPATYKGAPSELKSPINPVLLMIEDTNGNRKVDKEEEGKLSIVDDGYLNAEERTGFRTKKGAGYFIVTLNGNPMETLLTPYVLRVSEANKVDEDLGSTVKNNIPTKPAQLKYSSKKQFESAGYINLTDNKGDTDYFKVNITKDKTYSVQLTLPADLDGKVTIYDAKGKQVAYADQYGKGDAEKFLLSMKKGTYYIKVEDAFGHSSTEAYRLSVK
jgi:hypothetical protein